MKCIRTKIDFRNEHNALLFKSVVEKIESEKSQLREQITSLEQTVTNLEQDVTSMKERERLMVEYPDLNGPVNVNMAGMFGVFF